MRQNSRHTWWAKQTGTGKIKKSHKFNQSLEYEFTNVGLDIYTEVKYQKEREREKRRENGRGGERRKSIKASLTMNHGKKINEVELLKYYDPSTSSPMSLVGEKCWHRCPIISFALQWYYLYCGHLCTSGLIIIYGTKKFLWWDMRVAVIYGYRYVNVEISL